MPGTYEFACHSKVCAPPPVGRGGSTKIAGRASVRGLRKPDSGFTISRKLAPLRSGFAVALKGSDRLLMGKDAFGPDGKPSAKLVKLVQNRLTAAMRTKPPAGTKVALGGWHNPDDGKIEINVTVVFPRHREAQATKFAQAQDQIAMFALHKGEVIMTGGTGGDRQTG